MAGREPMRRARRRRRWGMVPAAVLICSALSCGHRSSAAGVDSTAAAATAARDTLADPLADVARAIVSEGTYDTASVADPGSIRGIITLDSVPVRHDTTLAGSEASVCGTRVPDRSVVTSGKRLESALVWVADIRSGKALPHDRRSDLAIVRCQFVPRVLALVNGTTINLQSKDATVHHTRFYSESEGALLSRMVTVDRWAVVPSARIAAQPGLVRVRLSRHPYVRGFVAVFDHPYFAVTNRYGRYTISGVPPGTYHVRIWHERADSVSERVVTVKPGRAAELDVTLDLH
jgi:Carboxypeptidase regulatory-like domain